MAMGKIKSISSQDNRVKARNSHTHTHTCKKKRFRSRKCPIQKKIVQPEMVQVRSNDGKWFNNSSSLIFCVLVFGYILCIRYLSGFVMMNGL